jgi:hypothetical protein
MSALKGTFSSALVLLAVCSCDQSPRTEPSVHVGTAVASSPLTAQPARPVSFFDEENLKKFKGRTVQEFASAAPIGYRDAYPIDEPPGKLIGFAFQFPNGVVADVYCNNLKYLVKYNEQGYWSLPTFLRETVTDIKVRSYDSKQ